MKRLLLILILGLYPAWACPVYADTGAARAHIESAIEQVDRADANTKDLRTALEQARKDLNTVAADRDRQLARAEAAENQFGYRAWKFIKFWFFALTTVTVAAYAAFVLAKMLAQIATGPFGAFVSIASTVLGGILPGSGWVDAVFSNLWFRYTKPRADDYAALKAAQQ